MSYENTLSLCLSFQPNSVTAQGAGLMAGGFGAALRPSLAMLVAGTAGRNAGSVAPIMIASPAGLRGSIAPMCLLDDTGFMATIDPTTMLHEARLSGSLEPQFMGIEMPQGGVKGVGLNGTNNRPNETGWFTRKLFINKTYNGKHYSRPDGLPLSPPPKKRRRYREEGGKAES